MALTFVDRALAEDLGHGDLTGEALLDESAAATASILLKERGVVCGLDVARDVFLALDQDVRFEARHSDGDRVEALPAVLAEVEGRARALVAGERTALNLLGRLSGIATLTRAYVDAVAGTGAVVLDTRKTTPGLRELEKYAVRCGGGTNHRKGLWDAILVKDNHLRIVGGVRAALERAHERSPGAPVTVEAETIAQVEEALAAGADRILLDNMSPAELEEAVRRTAGRAELEASGGITLEGVRRVARTGVDYVSVGALTHSSRSLDVSLEVT